MVFLALFLLNIQSNNENVPPEWREDKQVILNKFPNLGDFDYCYWKGEIIGENSRLSVGPSTYRVQGFVKLKAEDLVRFKKDFEWESITDNWYPLAKTEKFNYNDHQWHTSDEFEKFISSSYVGEFYLDFHQGVVYFDVQNS